MDALFIGVDVSKNRLDVHVRPSGQAFATARDGVGLADLVERLRAALTTRFSRYLISLSATGGTT